MSRRTPLLRWLLPALVAVLWLGLAGPLGAIGGQLTEIQENDNAAFLPDSAESREASSSASWVLPGGMMLELIEASSPISKGMTR